MKFSVSCGASAEELQRLSEKAREHELQIEEMKDVIGMMNRKLNKMNKEQKNDGPCKIIPLR